MTDITTPEALNALAVGSVVLDREGDVWRRMDDGVWLPLSGPDWPTPPIAAFLPATTLRPDRPSDLAAEITLALNRETLRGAVFTAITETIREHGDLVRVATGYDESEEVCTVDPDSIAEKAAEAVDAEVLALLAGREAE